jgi:hypothetical protein
MWSGTTTSVPSGYYLCDGTNGTPNLLDRFVVGAGNLYTVNVSGGFVAANVMTSAGVNPPLYYALAFIMKS